VLAGNPMEVNLGRSRSTSDEFDSLSGNKDLRPLMKLLAGRQELLRGFQPTEVTHWKSQLMHWSSSSTLSGWRAATHLMTDGGQLA
jgi:hypothetical protein